MPVLQEDRKQYYLHSPTSEASAHDYEHQTERWILYGAQPPDPQWQEVWQVVT